MANTQKYINHLLQNTGITPACSEEERLAAEDIARIFSDHGFDPEVQEFNAPAPARMGIAVMGVLAFVGALLMGIGGAIGLIGMLLAVVAAVLFGLDRSGRPVLAHLGQSGVSQNVIAYHPASGPLASPRNRPVVVVAHYDSPRAELLAREQYAPYRALIAKLLPIAMVAPAAIAIVRILPLPGFLKVLLWIAAIVLALVPLVNAVNIIANRFFMPYTSGSVCNKSSVAAMLGVMDAVAPYKGENEFPQDVPFDEYFGEQKRRAAEVARAAAAYAAAQETNDYGNTIEYEEPSYPDDAFGETVPEDEASQIDPFAQDEQPVASGTEDSAVSDSAYVPVSDETAEMPLPTVAAEEAAQPAEEAPVAPAEPEPKLYRNAAGNVRFGADTVRALGMLPESCAIEYDEGEDPATIEPEPAPQAVAASAPVTVEQVAPAPAPQTEQDAVSASDPFAYQTAPVPSDDHATAPSVTPVDESYADEFPQRISYESDTDFSAQPVADSPHADIASTFSALGDSASKFFKGAFKKGKKFVDEFEEKRAAARAAAEAEAIAEQERAEREREEAARAFEEQQAAEAAAADQPVEDASDTSDEAQQADATTTFAPVAEDESEAIDATATFVPSTADGTMSFDKTTSFEAPAAVEATATYDATMTFEAQPVAADDEVPASDDVDAADPAEPMAAEDEAADSESVSDPVQEEPISAPVSVPEVVATDSAEAPSATVTMPAADVAPSEQKPYSTQIFTMPASADTDATVSQPAAPAPQPDTVDSLMAQISSRVAPRLRTDINVPDPASTSVTQAKPGLRSVPDPSAPSMNQARTSSRSSLFDLPDPAAQEKDPFVTQGTEPKPAPSPAMSERIETISADDEAPAPAPKPKKRGLGGLFGRKKRGEQSMSDWLGVDDDYDAKSSGRGIGSWDNFEDDDDGWKGGATSSDGASSEEMLNAVASMGDDELLGHDIWFVATGASDRDGAGMKAFLSSHRDKLRGVFFINLESVGAGRLSVVTAEGEQRILKGDRRIANLVNKVSNAFHIDCGAFEMPYARTDAYAALESSRRALTIAGVDGPRLAYARTEDDLPYNIEPSNIDAATEIVTEVIRRS